MEPHLHRRGRDREATRERVDVELQAHSLALDERLWHKQLSSEGVSLPLPRSADADADLLRAAVLRLSTPPLVVTDPVPDLVRQCEPPSSQALPRFAAV